MKRCSCYVRGRHGERPRKRVLPHVVTRTTVATVYLPPIETDDPRCPVHGIAGRKIRRLSTSKEEFNA